MLFGKSVQSVNNGISLLRTISPRVVEAPSLEEKWQAKGFMDSGAPGAKVVTLLHSKHERLWPN